MLRILNAVGQILLFTALYVAALIVGTTALLTLPVGVGQHSHVIPLVVGLIVPLLLGFLIACAVAWCANRRALLAVVVFSWVIGELLWISLYPYLALLPPAPLHVCVISIVAIILGLTAGVYVLRSRAKAQARGAEGEG